MTKIEQSLEKKRDLGIFSSESRNKWLFLLLWVLFCLLLALNLLRGAADISALELAYYLSSWTELPLEKALILADFRIPKALAAALAGAGLSFSGLLLQTYFRNPIAGPYILGVSAGAGLGVAFLLMGSSFFASWGLSLSGPWAQAWAAALGSAFVLLLLLLASWRGLASSSLLLLGVLLGAAVSALVSLMEYFSPAESLQQFIYWSMGSVSGMRREDLFVLFTLQFLFIALASLRLLKALNVLLLGEAYAQSMGIDLGRLRAELLLYTAVLTGSITAFCGPIAFVGTAVPHIARWLFRSAEHRLLIPGSLLLGANMLLLCLFLSLLPGGEKALPLNALASLLAAPIVLWMLWRGRAMQAA